ncbi:hypothetical protein EJB05_56494, partial [Eragrostis curvula]
MAAAADLTDDLIVEILSRLPVKSICRFKCVSWHWYNLITKPEHRRKLPQTLSGFFYPGCRPDQEDNFLLYPNFEDISGGEELPFSNPSLSFLTDYRMIIPKMCCNGLLLCLCWKLSPEDECNYVVCNPATEIFVVLPDSDYHTGASNFRLGFDPIVSSHFHVFQILEGHEDYGFVIGMNIYSSKTGEWSHNGNGWVNEELQVVESRGVFFNGILHLMTNDFKILTVDTEGKTWRTISLLERMRVECFWRGYLAFIGQSQGQLYYINMRDRDTSILSVWVLEDYYGDEWKFKYNISTFHLFGVKDLKFERDYALIAIHPECRLIFFVWKCEDILMSYDMDRGKVSVICNLKEHLYDQFLPYLPYVPYLLDSLAG